MTIRPSKALSRRDSQSTGDRPRVDRKPVLDQALTQPICVVHVMAGFFYKTKRHWVGRTWVELSLGPNVPVKLSYIKLRGCGLNIQARLKFGCFLKGETSNFSQQRKFKSFWEENPRELEQVMNFVVKKCKESASWREDSHTILNYSMYYTSV